MGKFILRITENLGFEVWRDIPGYEGRYQASTYGRIRNKRNDRILSQHKSTKGYCIVSLGEKECKVHRLVAMAFIPNPSQKAQVNHKDENKENNNVSNLEWATNYENHEYGTRNQRVVSTMIKNGNAKRVIMLNLDGEILKSFNSFRSAEQYVGGKSNGGNIYACCNNKAKTAYGYRWRYE